MDYSTGKCSCISDYFKDNKLVAGTAIKRYYAYRMVQDTKKRLV